MIADFNICIFYICIDPNCRFMYNLLADFNETFFRINGAPEACINRLYPYRSFTWHTSFNHTVFVIRVRKNTLLSIFVSHEIEMIFGDIQS